VTNEFTAAPDVPADAEIDSRDWEGYLQWADSTVTATLVDAEEYHETVDLRLDLPFAGMYAVRYPWDAVRSVPGLMDAVDLLIRGRSKGGCYGYDMGCRCPNCMVQDNHDLNHEEPTEGCQPCAEAPVPMLRPTKAQ
jgi:hypothetical protein